MDQEDNGSSNVLGGLLRWEYYWYVSFHTHYISLDLLTLIQDPRLSDQKMPPSTDQARLPSWFAGRYVL